MLLLRQHCTLSYRYPSIVMSKLDTPQEIWQEQFGVINYG